MKRRSFLTLTLAAAAPALAQQPAQTRFQPAQDIGPLVAQLTKGAAIEQGGIEVQLPQIAENGNAVPLHIRVASAMTPAEHVKAIHVFAERNPRPRVATFHLGPDAGRADVMTRVRLGGTQNVTVLAELSGGRWRVAAQNVLVTTGACLDEGSL